MTLHSSIMCAPRKNLNSRKEAKKMRTKGGNSPRRDEKGAHQQAVNTVRTYANKFFQNPSMGLGTEITKLFVGGAGAASHRIFIGSLLRDAFGINAGNDGIPYEALNLKSQKTLYDLANGIWKVLPEEAKLNREELSRFIAKNKTTNVSSDN